MRNEPIQYRRAIANIYLRKRRLRDAMNASAIAYGYDDPRTLEKQALLFEVHNALHAIIEITETEDKPLPGDVFIQAIKISAAQKRRAAIRGITATEVALFVDAISHAARNAYGDHWNLGETDGYIADHEVEILEGFLQSREITDSAHGANVIRAVYTYGIEKFGEGQFGRPFTIGNLGGELHPSRAAYLEKIISVCA